MLSRAGDDLVGPDESTLPIFVATLKTELRKPLAATSGAVGEDVTSVAASSPSAPGSMTGTKVALVLAMEVV